MGKWEALIIVLALSADGKPERVAETPVPPLAEKQQDSLARYGSARLAQARGRSTQALKELEALSKSDPDAVAPLRDLVTVYIDLGREAAAIRTAQKVLRLDPDDVETAHRLAKLQFSSRRFDQAATTLQAVLESPTLTTRPSKKLAMLMDLARFHSENPTKAVEDWTAVSQYIQSARTQLLRDGFDAADLDQEALFAQEQRAKALIAEKRFEEAILELRKLLRPALEEARMNQEWSRVVRLQHALADALAAKGDIPAAIVEMEQLLDLNPRWIEPYQKYAGWLRKTRQGSQVVLRLSRLSEANPKLTDLRWLISAERIRSNDPEGHKAFLEMVTVNWSPLRFQILVEAYADADRTRDFIAILNTIYPNMDRNSRVMQTNVVVPDPQRRHAFAQAFLARLDIAFLILREAAREPRLIESSESWDLLAWAAERLGRPMDAEIALRAAVRAAESGNSYRPLLRLRAHLMARRKWQETLDMLDEQRRRIPEGYILFLKLAPLAELGFQLSEAQSEKAAGETRFGTLREKARALGILGNYPRMKAACEAMLQEFQRPDEIRSIRFLLADALHGMRDYEQGERELRTLIEEDPDDPLALNNLGYNLADQNRNLEEAEAMIRTAIELDRDERARAGDPQRESGVYLDSLGWVLFRRGQLKEARQMLEAAAQFPDGATDAVVWDHLGDVCFRLNDRVAARDSWTKAVKAYTGVHVGKQNGRLEEVKRKLKQIE